MRIVLLIICLFCFCGSSIAQSVAYDTSTVTQRAISTTAINQLKKSPDFSYIEMQEPPKSLWDRFWAWVWWKIAQLLSTKNGRFTFWTAITLVAAVIIGYFLLKVMGMNKVGLFARNAAGKMAYTVGDDDIHNISFNEAIQQAISSGDFRLAIRLLYLQSLKLLSDKGHIKWQINKTNSDYIKEVAHASWYALFVSLTFKFEYTWYGELKIEKADFEQLQVQFQQLNKQLK